MTFGIFTGAFMRGILYGHADYPAVFASASILLAVDVVLRLSMSDHHREAQLPPNRYLEYGTLAETEAQPVPSTMIAEEANTQDV